MHLGTRNVTITADFPWILPVQKSTILSCSLSSTSPSSLASSSPSLGIKVTKDANATMNMISKGTKLKKRTITTAMDQPKYKLSKVDNISVSIDINIMFFDFLLCHQNLICFKFKNPIFVLQQQRGDMRDTIAHCNMRKEMLAGMQIIENVSIQA